MVVPGDIGPVHRRQGRGIAGPERPLPVAEHDVAGAGGGTGNIGPAMHGKGIARTIIDDRRATL